MRQYRILARSLMTGMVLLVNNGAAQAHDAVQSGEPLAVAQFPRGYPLYYRQVDGTSVISVSKEVFMSSPEDPLRWTDIALWGWKSLSRGSWCPVGGDTKCLFFWHSGDDGDYSLYRIKPGEEPRKLRDLASARVAFASERIGVIAERNNLVLTTDGGETWKSPVTIASGGTEAYSLLWASMERLIVGGQGLVECFDLIDNRLVSTWRSRPSAEQVIRLVPDGESHIWVQLGTEVSRLDLATGRSEIGFSINLTIDGLATCHGMLLLWHLDPKNDESPGVPYLHTIQVWSRDESDNRYRRKQRISAPPIAAIMELEAPKCLLVTQAGQGMILDLSTGSLASQELQVAQAPKVEEQDPNYASKEEVRAAFKLLMQLPKEEREVIARELGRKLDWTPKQKTEWMAEQARLALERQGAGEVNGAGDEKGGEGQGE